MIIKVENLGIVKEASVDLGKDLIILAGENNTGKTYVAYTVYHLLNIDCEERSKVPGTLFYRR